MTTSTQTTVTNLGVAMFVVADQDAALTFYTETLGWELRGDSRFGPGDSMRWLEVAPPGSTARLALNPPMGGAEPGGSSIGVETTDLETEHARLLAVDGLGRRRRDHGRTGHAAHVHAARPGREHGRRGGAAARRLRP